MGRPKKKHRQPEKRERSGRWRNYWRGDDGKYEMSIEDLSEKAKSVDFSPAYKFAYDHESSRHHDRRRFMVPINVCGKLAGHAANPPGATHPRGTLFAPPTSSAGGRWRRKR